MDARYILQRRYLRPPHKLPLQVISSKAPSSESLSHHLMLIEWNKIGETFLNTAKLTQAQSNLKIHIFFNKAEKDSRQIHQIRENFGGCLTLHESLTDSEDAAWTDLLAFLINFYTKTLISCHHCSVAHPSPKYNVTLVTSQEDRYIELVALLKSNKADTKIIDGLHSTILDVFPHVCHECRLIFSKKDEADKHDRSHHNFLCTNKSCERNKRENGFFTKYEQSEHIRKQKRCEFCTELVYCDRKKFKEHMNKYHVFCTCSCGKYYRGTDEYIDHYCGLFPLPCLESPECEQRFKNIDEQAFHHKTSHGSVYPYFCIACYGMSKLVCLQTSDELMRHVSEMKHKDDDFQIIVMPDD